MKEKDLLVDCPEHQLILYAEKNDGTYGPVQTGAYTAGNHISEHYKIVGNLNKSLIERLQNGEISPIYYYMMIEDLSVSELAGRTRISKICVKKHITPKGFKKVSISKLKRYADVLNIPLANMFQIIHTIEDRNWDIGYQEDIGSSKSSSISQAKTKNQFLVETKVIQKLK